MQKIGRYEIVRQLGAGGMGVVWLGRDPNLERQVAIKSIRPEGLQDPTALPRLRREAKAAAQLSHPGIVATHDFVEDGEMVYIVMEYVDGHSLADATISRDLCLRVVQQCAAALDHAHARGVIHRNVKPSNIMLTKFDEAKIADFGIAKRIGSMTDLTGGMAIGTLEYMSPEQLAGKSVDGRADQYSLAVVAYKLLTGRAIFDAGDMPAWCYAVANSKPVAASSRDRTLPAAVDGVLERALSKTAAGRYDNCAEFARELSKALSSAPKERPSRIPLGAVALVAVAAALSGWVYLRPKGGPPQPAKAAQEPPESTVNEVRVNSKDGLKYVWIGPGKFRMGCSAADTECDPDEKPVHEVSITKGFWIGQTEVTQAAWRRLMKSNPSGFQGDDLPVEKIDWHQALAYCTAAGLRLPTEAEWEYAARGGTESARYGNLDEIAWHNGNSGNKTHPVADHKKPNAYGLYDMLGNVWEWVNDFHRDYPAGPVSDPGRTPTESPTIPRVVRGGSWVDYPRDVRASIRIRNEPSYPYSHVGVRCAGEQIS